MNQSIQAESKQHIFEKMWTIM